MMKLLFNIFIVVAIFITTILLICHLRYPFYYSVDSDVRWSVATGITKSLDSVAPQTVLCFKSVDEITPTLYLADPFVLEVDSGYFLFVEHVSDSNGNISWFYSDDFINWEFGDTVIDEIFHLSYPQIFTYNEEFYIIPESGQSEQVLLYKADKFPDKWSIADTLINDMVFKDPALLIKDDNFYLFGYDEKYVQRLYFSNTLFDNWQEHSASPLGIGNTKRPGGRIFEYNDAIYLPVQGTKRGYGSKLYLHKIKTLSPEYVSLDRSPQLFLEGFEHIKFFKNGVHHFDAIFKENKIFYAIDGRGYEYEPVTLQVIRASLVKNGMDLLDFLGIIEIPDQFYSNL
ncbi:hypothetical protein QA597_05390 [Marinilabiliaceae bacterium ANBcel2]|nr:hypothetical protein [Marinilabiliaceae bacterium ANBcel2]